jgi:hypothetical protein
MPGLYENPVFFLHLVRSRRFEHERATTGMACRLGELVKTPLVSGEWKGGLSMNRVAPRTSAGQSGFCVFENADISADRHATQD